MAQHALKLYEKKIGKIDGLLLLQPTSPLRSKKTLIKCIKTFKNKKCDSVITVKKASMNPKFLVQINNNLIKPILKGANEKRLPKDIYQPDGSIYLIKPSVLKNSEKFYGKRKRNNIKQNKAVQQLITGSDCNSKFVLEYFDQLGTDCGNCNHCIHKDQTQKKSEKNPNSGLIA